MDTSKSGHSSTNSSSPSQSPRASQDMPRTPLSHRLGHLFSSRPPSPMVLDELAEGVQKLGLGLNTQNHTQVDSKNYQKEPAPTQQVTPSSHAPKPKVPIQSAQRSTPRIVRRFGKDTQTCRGALDKADGDQNSDSDGATSVALHEALSEDLFDYSKSHNNIPRPPPARLNSLASAHTYTSFKSEYSIKHPVLLENLGRSTFPTSSVVEDQPQIPQTRVPSPPPSTYPFSVLFNGSKSSPPRTSIDTLRALQAQDRALHTLRAGQPAQSPLCEDGTVDSSRGFSWWSKKDADQLLHPDDQAPTAQEEGDKIKKTYRTPKNPIVFCHGIFGFDSISLGASFAPLQISHWRGITEILQAAGAEVLITRVPATSSPDQRAKVLAEIIESNYPGRSVHLIGHSMGGLDCRYLASRLQPHYNFKVLSVTTIASPHRGSSFADHFLTTIGRERLPTMLSLVDMLPIGGGDGKAFESLTIESMRLFNDQTPDAPDVQYFSWGAEFEPALLDPFRWPHSVVFEKEGPNDGLVSVESAKWGTFLGTLKGVSHLDLVGWVNTARYTWSEWTGKTINFKPGTFYLGIADHIACVVEKLEDDSPADSKDAPEAQKGSLEGVSKADKDTGVD